MDNPKSPAEELQALAKSVLARQINDVLEPEGSDERKMEEVRVMVEKTIGYMPASDPFKAVQAFAKSILAYQVKDVLDNDGISVEEKVGHIRGLVRHFIIDLSAR